MRDSATCPTDGPSSGPPRSSAPASIPPCGSTACAPSPDRLPAARAILRRSARDALMSPPRTTREPVTIIAELRFDPAHREPLLELARRHVRNTLAAERGCLRFELIAPKDDPGGLVFCEMFASDAAFQAHRDSAHSAWFRDARAPYGVQAS